MEALQLGIFAALLQVAGYAFYGSKVLKRDIRPNATSWLMFAYGTTLLLVVEWDRDASFALLALPAACALSSIVVALHALRKADLWWPENVFEKFSFSVDMFLTIAYVSTWIFLVNNFILEEEKAIAEIIILVCVNITTFTAFFPLLRQVYYHPATEHTAPWTIWTLAYTLLGIATYVETGLVGELMIYPLVNVALHGYIAFHTAAWRYRNDMSIA